MAGVTLFIFTLGLLTLEIIRMVLRIQRESASPTRQVQLPDYKCRNGRQRVLRASRPGHINLEETDLKAEKGVNK